MPLGTSILTVAELLQQFLVHCDVVELAKRILNLLYVRYEILPAPNGSLAWEGWGKEFSGVAKLLGLDAQFVPVLRIQPIQMLATFQDLLPLATQLLRCRSCERASPQHARGVVGVARPIARLDASFGLECKIAKAQAFYRRACTRKCILAFSPKLLRNQRCSWPITLAVRDWPRHMFQQNLKFPRRAELAGNPFEFALESLRLRVGQHIGE